MARATATKVGEPAPPLELPDTDGDVHALPAPGEAPATVVFWTCNHCPYALAWHDRLVEVGARLRRRAASASWPSTPTTPSATRATRSRRCASGSARRTGRSPTCTTKARTRRAPGPPRSPRTSTCSTRDLRIRYEGAPDADHMDPALRRRLAARGARRGARGGEASRAGDRARRLLDQVEAVSVTDRRRLVRVPASSANLGPGYDVLAAALSLHLELEVTEAGEFSVEAGGHPVPDDRSNLCVRAFEALHPADGLRFEIRSEIPLARGLGSSAAAIVAGLMAADHLFELGLERERDLRPRGRARGPPRQRRRGALRGLRALPAGRRRRAAAAAGAGSSLPRASRACVVIPDEEVPTEQARAAMPADVPVDDAVANVAAASQLVLGIERSDLTLIARGLADRLHQPNRAAPLSPLDGAARRRRRTSARSGRRSPAPGPRCSSGASGRTPARSPRPCASGSAAGRRSAAPRSRRWAPTSPSFDQVVGADQLVSLLHSLASLA